MKDKIILNDKSEIEIESASSLSDIKIITQTKSEMISVWSMMTEENLKSVQIRNSDNVLIASYDNLILKSETSIIQRDNTILTSFYLREKTEVELLKEKYNIIDEDDSNIAEEDVSIKELQEMKIKEMNLIQQSTIQNGVNVTLTNGTVEHFTLTDHDQTSLMGLQAKVALGDDKIPWHTSDESEHCKFYSNADMGVITNTAMQFITWHVTYFRDLRIYIRSFESKEEITNVTYGMNIPVEYQSEPLQAMIAEQIN